MTTVGLDFGTSNSSIALFRDGSIQMFPLDPGSLNTRMLRSFIFVTRSHDTHVGTAAVQQYLALETGRPVYWETRNMGQVQMVVGGGGSGPIIYWDDLFIQVDTNAQGRLLQSIKTALRNSTYEGTKIFEKHYTIESLIAILLRYLRKKCASAIDQEVDGVVLGRPVKFSDDPAVTERAQNKIEAAARLAGFKHIAFELEPVAAAYVYHRDAAKRQCILVFDFGGGTLDLTVMQVGGSQPPDVLATNGVLIGGDDLDRSLMRPLRSLFGESATMRDRTPFPAHLLQMLDSWQTMVMLSRPEYNSLFRSARRGSDPEAVHRLETLVSKNLGFPLFQGLEQAKMRLSTEATAWIELNEQGLRLREMFTRPQFERLIDPFIVEVEKAVDEILKQSGLSPGQVQAVLRTGGSSQVPAFIRMLTSKFGYDRLRALSHFESIVGGLAIKASEMG